jgi:hypothetical protein
MFIWEDLWGPLLCQIYKAATEVPSLFLMDSNCKFVFDDEGFGVIHFKYIVF